LVLGVLATGIISTICWFVHGVIGLWIAGAIMDESKFNYSVVDMYRIPWMYFPVPALTAIANIVVGFMVESRLYAHEADALPAGWTQTKDRQGRICWVHQNKGKTT
jgi:hypothetical protein